MATVPMDPSVDLNANPMGRFVAPEVAAPAVQQGPDYTGKQMEAMGTAMITSGSAAIKIAERIQDDIDETYTRQADYETGTFFNQLQTKYLTTEGQNAVEGYNPVIEEMNKFAAEKMANLQNDMQRKMYNQVFERRMLAAQSNMSAHQLKALKDWKTNTIASRIDNLINEAASEAANKGNKLFTEGASFRVLKEGMLKEVQQLALAKGIIQVNSDGEIVNEKGEVGKKSEQYEELVRKANTKLHEIVVSQFVAMENPKMAATYLNAYRGEIDAGKLDNLTKTVRDAEKIVGAKDESLRLQLDFAAKKVPLNDAMSAVNQMFQDGKITSEVRDMTVQRLEHSEMIQRQQEVKVNAQLLDKAQMHMLNGGTLANLPTPLLMWAQQNGRLADLKRLEKTGGQGETNYAVYGRLITMPAEELAKMSSDDLFNKYRAQLSKGDYEQMLVRLAAAKATVGKADNKPELTVLETNAEIVSRAAKENKILPFTGTPNENQQKDFAGFEKEVQRRVNEYEITQLGGKRKANTDEVKKITGMVLLDKVKIDEWGRDPDKFSYQITPDNAKKAYVNVDGKQVYLAQIPVADREQIVAGLKRRGLPVTQQEIARVWLLGQKK